MWSKYQRSIKLPLLTGSAILLTSIIYYLQINFAPSSCQSAVPIAECSANSLVRTNTEVGLILLPLMHGSWSHFIFNIGLLAMFGWPVEILVRRRFFMKFLFIAAYAPIEVRAVWNILQGIPPLSLGVSGAVYALAGFLAAILAPTTVNGLIEMTSQIETIEGLTKFMFFILSLATILEAFLAHYHITSVGPKTATLVHLAGAILGALIGIYVDYADSITSH